MLTRAPPLAGNVVLIGYVAIRVRVGHARGEAALVYCVLGTGIAGLVALAFVWQVQVSGHSVPLLLLAGVAGVADTMSSVVFLPIVGRFPSSLSVPFAAGEASTSIVASLLAIVQDPGPEGANRFSVAVYFGLMACVMVLSGAAYSVLRFHAVGRRHAVLPPARSVQERQAALPKWPVLARMHLSDLLCTVALNFVENGLFVSVTGYAVQPYGDAHYKAALWGGMVAAPLGSLLTLWVRAGAPLMWLCVWAPLSVAVLINALLPVPVLVHSSAFGAFVATLVIVARFLLSYTKSLVYVRVLRRSPTGAQERAMLLVGCAQQAGASTGALVFFLLVYFSVIGG